MKETDSDYDQKKEKFIECIKAIDTDECIKDCSKCKLDISSEDFTYFLVHMGLPKHEC